MRMISYRPAVLVAFLLTSGLATADDTPKKYSAAAFYENSSYVVADTEFAVSRDGKRLLIASDATGIFNSYALDLETGDQTPLTTSDDEAVFSVSYFPDGTRFLYTSDKGGNELDHLYVGEPGKGILDLTPGDESRAGVCWLGR